MQLSYNERMNIIPYRPWNELIIIEYDSNSLRAMSNHIFCCEGHNVSAYMPSQQEQNVQNVSYRQYTSRITDMRVQPTCLKLFN